ncbi:MAG TPA: Gfo/Idh/MocA family oxidoreductase [Actinophytocola sp.]|jgi:predicted dehydrogenase|uniref:Gfo/Idh/MocA family protein n=1 Tax=Actinophytocola sp. TaxID=1872138 RepID=UPI002E097266|nr:Gfo/Idh/MocA family oxidoreductase [Actinophytocola sp.]
MAAPTIPPIRLGLIGTGLAVEKLHWPALRRLADRYVVTAFTDRSAEQGRRSADYSETGRLHLMVWRHAGRLVPREGRFTGTPWRRPQYRGGVRLDAGVHHIAQIRLLRGDIVRVHAAVHAANSTIDAPSDLALNLVFTGGAIGNYTASYPEIPVPPEPNDMRLYGTEGVLAGSVSERRVTRGNSDATTHTTVFRGIDNGYRAELIDFADAVQFGVRPVGSVAQSVANAMVVQRGLDSAERAAVLALDPVPGAGPVPLWRPRGATGPSTGCQDNASAVRRRSPHKRPAARRSPRCPAGCDVAPVGTRPLDRMREEWSWKRKRTGRGARFSG